MYMLDTNICIYIINRRPRSVLEKFEALKRDSLCVSVITQAELQFGVEKSSKPKQNQSILDAFFVRLIVLSWNSEAAIEYGRIRKRLEKKGTPIGNMDLLISAHALSGDHILVTNNLKEFMNVQGLSCENWT